MQSLFKPLLTGARRLFDLAFAGRLRALAVLLAMFLAFNAAVRLGLAAYNADFSLFLPWRILPALAIGALFDLVVATCFLAPLALLIALLRTDGARAPTWALALVLAPLSVLMVFVGASEFTFWNEFASRFNFIAVDYLIYTNEVIGNIRESYNLPLLLAVVAVLSFAVWAFALWRMRPHLQTANAPWRTTLAALALWLASPLAAVAVADARYKEFSDNAQLNELAGNGYFDFWHAFWHNEIDYERFYKTMPRQRAARELAIELAGHGKLPVTLSQRPFEREVSAADPAKPMKPLNVVLVSIESFSAEFMTAFGNKQDLTPNLDRLAREGMLFTHLYATGTRTVRGLEALSLSVPPTPGHSIVKRPDNAHLFTIGEVFKEKGYEPLYLYGGYGYFDNMNAFFSGNGYTVVDRTALKPEEIHFENIWGVADEDLFTLALRELDARYAADKRFFAHVMTVSNHRPFTYPAGRIDIPSKTSREGGVKYTDWAIGNFIERARAKPWFDDTLFVFVADHTHKGRGRQELPIENYHIPMVIYAPQHVRPAVIDTIASQIDVAPTILGLLNASYRSKFFGHDILRDGPGHQRALMANYQTVGYYEDGRVVELKPNARYRIVDAASGMPQPMDERNQHLLDEAISYYQLASQAYRDGGLKVTQTDAASVAVR
jgi:phosphoglycerol transferase MdoB-like AlkP superfamily enzyme